MRRVITLMVTVGLVGVAHAQPAVGGPEPNRPGAALDDPRPLEGEINYERLRRRVSEARQRADRLERALERLEAGEPLREVLSDLRPDERRYFLPWSPRAERAPGAGRGLPRGVDGGTDRGPGRGPERGWRERTGERQPEAPRLDSEAPVTREQVRSFIRERLPQLSQHLENVEAGNAEAGARMLDRLMPRISEVILAGRRDEALGRLKLQELELGLSTIKIAREAREASRGQSPSSERIEATRERLRANLIAQAEIRAQIQRREIELLELRLEALRTELAERESERDVVVDEMLDQMMRRLVRTDRDPSAGGDRAGDTPADPG